MNRLDVVEGAWPYDGPHDADSVADAAAAVSLLVRYLNNATLRHRRQVLERPATTYVVVARLASVVYGLDQLLDQLAAALAAQATSAGLYDDRRDRPASSTVAEAVAYLIEARQRAATVAEALEAAQSATSHLGKEGV